jgi:hypothetical protein
MKSNRTLIIVIVVLLVLCCCCTLAVAGYYGWQTYQTAQQTIDDFVPVPPDLNQPDSDQPDSIFTEEPSIPDVDVPVLEAGAPPQGGLADDVLRNDTWQYIHISAVALGCNEPDAAASTIEVTAEPDAIGIWSERWTIACTSGGEQAFDVEFIPTDGGGTTFNITPIIE